METVPVYVGYDPKESISWHVFVQSIMETSSSPLSIHPVYVKNYRKIFNRVSDSKQSNEFSFSRFLVPYLQNYQGTAIFMDCDMLMRTDINELYEIGKIHPEKAVHVVQHDYEPKDKIKYLGQAQHSYPRKNWSSVVVWNCGHKANKNVTPDFVNNGTGAELHRFTWLKDKEIGSLDVSWNWLVGEYVDTDQKVNVKNVHWTVGGPYFDEYCDVEFSEQWREMEKIALRCDQLD
jgi:lipopolysaccharide biosynthesis glycosyltransferase